MQEYVLFPDPYFRVFLYILSKNENIKGICGYTLVNLGLPQNDLQLLNRSYSYNNIS